MVDFSAASVAPWKDSSVLYFGPVMVRINILSGTLPPHKEMAMKEHADIIRYLAAGQKEFAILAMREHVKMVASRILVSMN